MARLRFDSLPDVFRQLADLSEWHFDAPLSYPAFCVFVYRNYNHQDYRHFNDGLVQMIALFLAYSRDEDSDLDEEEDEAPKTVKH